MIGPPAFTPLLRTLGPVIPRESETVEHYGAKVVPTTELTLLIVPPSVSMRYGFTLAYRFESAAAFYAFSQRPAKFPMLFGILPLAKDVARPPTSRVHSGRQRAVRARTRRHASFAGQNRSMAHSASQGATPSKNTRKEIPLSMASRNPSTSAFPSRVPTDGCGVSSAALYSSLSFNCRDAERHTRSGLL